MRVGPGSVAEAVGYANDVAKIKIEHGQVDLCTKTYAKVIEMQFQFLGFELIFFILIIYPAISS